MVAADGGGGEDGTAIEVPAPLRILACEDADVDVDQHGQRGGIQEQPGTVAGEGVFADRHERVGPSSRPGIVGGSGTASGTCGRRVCRVRLP